MNLSRFPNPIELNQIRRPGAADRLAGHHHHCVAHFEVAALKQQAVHLRKHLAIIGGRHPGFDRGVFLCFAGCSGVGAGGDGAAWVSAVCGGRLKVSMDKNASTIIVPDRRERFREFMKRFNPAAPAKAAIGDGLICQRPGQSIFKKLAASGSLQVISGRHCNPFKNSTLQLVACMT